MEDEQFLVTLPPVPYQRYALLMARKHQLVEELRRVRAKWMPRVEIYERDDDRSIVTAEASITRLAVTHARSPTVILTAVANEVVVKLQEAIGRIQTDRAGWEITPLDMHETLTRWPWDGG
jgi:hypothetical protein